MALCFGAGCGDNEVDEYKSSLHSGDDVHQVTYQENRAATEMEGVAVWVLELNLNNATH